MFMKDSIYKKLEEAFLYHNIKPSFFRTLYESGPRKLVTEVIQENFSLIISKCDSLTLPSLIENLASYDDMNSFIMENTDVLLSQLGNHFFSLPERFQRRDYINNQFLEVVDTFSKSSLYALASFQDFIDCNHKKDLNQFLEMNKEEYIFYLLGRQLGFVYTKERLEPLFSVLVGLVDEILVEEGLSYSDIILFPQGSYSDVIGIGSKVIKVGGKRFNYHIPNSPYLLQPLIRVNLEDISLTRGTLEVEEKTLVSSDISTSEVYSIYEKLRSQGILWLDAKPSNIGRLLKDNVCHYSKALSLDMKNRGFDNNIDTVLSSGNYVIVDLDHLYWAEDVFGDPNLYHLFRTSDSFYYEMLYQEHLKYSSLEKTVAKEKTIKC